MEGGKYGAAGNKSGQSVRCEDENNEFRCHYTFLHTYLANVKYVHVNMIRGDLIVPFSEQKVSYIFLDDILINFKIRQSQ